MSCEMCEHGEPCVHCLGNAATAAVNLAAAVREVLGTLNYCIGPAARTAVSRESEHRYWRVLHAVHRVEGKACPRCDDTGTDKRYVGEHACLLADEPGHATAFPLGSPGPGVGAASGRTYPLWRCPECGYHGIRNVTGGVGEWPGDGKVRCPSRTCDYDTVMEQVDTLATIAPLDDHREPRT